MKRWLIGIVVALVLGAGVAALAAITAQSVADSRAWSRAAAEIEANPRSYDMIIVRDAWGVPTIFGATDPDTAYGLAYAHAEDDFPVMQERLAIVRRDLGRLKGKVGAEADYFGHLLDARRLTTEGYGRLSPEALAVARAYADGLNAYALENPDEVVLGRLFPVRERDIVEGFVLISPLFFGIDQVIGDLVEGKNLDMSETFGPPDDRGSNAFALNGNRMADGSTVLVSNSHQPWYGVVAWYEARLASGAGPDGEPWSMQGSTFPGAPTILMGHNAHLGWTNTVNAPDMVDVYRLELDGSGKRYRLDGEWHDLERRRVWLRVKVGPFLLPVPRMFERSVHGPVIRNDEGAFALRYGGEGETRHLEQYYRLQHTTNLGEWRAVMDMQAIPGTNFIYADEAGNIGLLYNARLPERDPTIDWSGVLPGDRSDLIWTTYEPPEDIPWLLNPPSGFVFNANNAPFDATHPDDDFKYDDFPDLVGIESRRTNRAARAQALLSADESVSMDELHAIKMDTVLDPRTAQGQSVDEVIAEMDGEARELMEAWDWNFDGEGRGDALALVALHHVWPSTYFDVKPPTPAEVAALATGHLLEHFGELDPPLGEVLRLRRGETDLPLSGAPGVLRAIHSKVEDDGRFSAWNGDSYILEVRWPADGSGPVTRTVMPHGSGVADADSPHHADQAELFAAGRYKPSPLPRYSERPAR